MIARFIHSHKELLIQHVFERRARCWNITVIAAQISDSASTNCYETFVLISNNYFYLIYLTSCNVTNTLKFICVSKKMSELHREFTGCVFCFLCPVYVEQNSNDSRHSVSSQILTRILHLEPMFIHLSDLLLAWGVIFLWLWWMIMVYSLDYSNDVFILQRCLFLTIVPF